MESRHQQRRHAAGAVRLLPSIQLQLQRLDIDDRVRHVRLHQKTPRPQDSGDPPYDHAVNRILVRPGLRRSQIRLSEQLPVRFDRYVPPLFALFGQCLRRPQFGTFDVDELLAVAEPRNEGAEQARHLRRQEDQTDRRAAAQRFV